MKKLDDDAFRDDVAALVAALLYGQLGRLRLRLREDVSSRSVPLALVHFHPSY